MERPLVSMVSVVSIPVGVHQMPTLDADAVVDVLVVGAGPTGLTAAAELIRAGLTVRIIESKHERSPDSKALILHARTMELFPTSVASELCKTGLKFAGLNVRIGRRHRLRSINLLDQPWGDTAFPFWLSVPQYETEKVFKLSSSR